jgi:hypothetical protein
MYVVGEGAQERQARSALNEPVYHLLLRYPKATFARAMKTMVHLLALGILTVQCACFLLPSSFDPILILNANRSWLLTWLWPRCDKFLTTRGYQEHL